MAGDLNEPSWRDWNQAAFEAGVHPAVAQFPVTYMLETKGNFTDTYRAFFPDVLKDPGGHVLRHFAPALNASYVCMQAQIPRGLSAWVCTVSDCTLLLLLVAHDLGLVTTLAALC